MYRIISICSRIALLDTKIRNFQRNIVLGLNNFVQQTTDISIFYFFDNNINGFCIAKPPAEKRSAGGFAIGLTGGYLPWPIPPLSIAISSALAWPGSLPYSRGSTPESW